MTLDSDHNAGMLGNIFQRGKRAFAKTLVVLVVLVVPLPARSICRYLPEANTIWVYDYPETAPCTPADLLRADKMFGWHLIEYDASADVYTIAAHLRIGNNDGSDTFFQIGSRAHPEETIVLRGNLVIYPEWLPGQSIEKRGRNCLTLGLADAPGINAALKFYNEPNQSHTIFSGAYYRGADTPTNAYGGRLHVYHSTITAALPDRQHAIGAAGNRHFYLPGYHGEVIFKRATIAWVAGVIGFGLSAKSSSITDSVFENSGYALINNDQAATNCVFRHLGCAVKDWGGPLDVLLTDCVFEDNDANWSISRGRLRCIDCMIGAPKKGNFYGCWPAQKEGKMPYGFFQSLRHVVVEVKNQAGQPITKARVEITTLQDPLIRQVAFTGHDGCTPGKGASEALLLIERQETATDTPNTPQVIEYNYTLTVSAGNYQTASISDIRPTNSWEFFRMVLEKNSSH